MKSHLLYILISLPALRGFALQIDSTVKQNRLPGVTINGEVLDKSTVPLLDSSEYLFSFNSSLAEIADQNSAVYVKSYYPGGLSSISIKGSNASHTNVLWNGIPVNSIMHGQIDYSLIAVSFFPNISLASGATSWGIGGDLNLEDRIRWNTLSVNAGLNAGSFGKTSADVSIENSTSRFFNHTAFSFKRAENDYPYENFLSPEGNRDVLRHAAYEAIQLKELAGIRLGNHSLSFTSWLTFSHREIPPVIGAGLNPYEHQKDQAWRNQINWSFSTSKFQMDMTAAYFNELLFYRLDKNTASNHSSQSIRSRIRLVRRLNKIKGEVLLRYNYDFANSPDLLSNAHQHESQLNTFIDWSPSTAFRIQPGFRFGFYDTEFIPFSPYLSIFWSPENKFLKTIHFQSGRKFHIPTFNDRYWLIGGNQELEIETAWHLELIFIWDNPKKTNFNYSLQIIPFIKWVDNMILWTPDNGIWSPANVKATLSRGVSVDFESRLHLSSDLSLFFENSFLYNKSTVRKSIVNGDASVGKQLIYVPLLQIYGKAGINWKGWASSVTADYTSTRFNTTDNSYGIKPFYAIDISFSKVFEWRKTTFLAKLSANNIIDQQYRNIALRPMPGRNFEFSVLLNFRKSIK